MLAEIPVVLRVDIYATVALLGAAVTIVGRRSGLRPEWAALAGGVARFVLRLVSVWQHWQLPRAGGF